MPKRTKAEEIEAELIEATGSRRKRNEPQEAWVKRLCAAAVRMEEGDLEELSDEAFEFADSVADAIENEEAIPNFDGTMLGDDEEEEEADEDEEEADEEESDEEEEEADEEESDEEEEEADEEEPDEEEEEPDEEEEEEEPEEKPKRRASKRKAKKKAKRRAKKTVKRKPATRSIDQPKESKTRIFRAFVIDNLDLSRGDLMNKAHDEGCELPDSSMSAVTYHVAETIELLREAGFKDLPIPMCKRSSRAQALDEAKKAPAKKAPAKKRRKRRA